MKYYVIINGNSSLDIQGLAIESLPNISKPLIRTTREEIDGRDGDIITKLGYSAYDKTLNIGLWGNYDINEVIAFFNEEGVITFSNEPDKYYKFHILNRIDFVNQLEKFKKASITIHCQPFKYKEQEAKVIEEEAHTTSGTSFNLSDTLEAPLLIDLKGNTSQTGTPTPSSPIPVNVVSGDNDIVVEGKNLFDNSHIEVGKSWYGTSNSKRARWYLKLSAGTEYTIKMSDFTNISQIAILETTSISESGKQKWETVRTAPFTQTHTFSNDAIYLVIQFESANDFTREMANNIKLMLNYGDSVLPYEPYNGTTYNIDLPVENLYQLPNNETKNYITFTKNNDGTFNLSGTATAQTSFILYLDYNETNIKDGKTYTFSANKSLTSGVSVRAEVYNNTTWVRAISNELSSTTQTTTGTANLTGGNKIRYSIWVSNGTQVNITNCGIQLELGSKSNTYTPYGTTPIELNKIGTYQDYIYKENDKWYLHKEIGKVVLNGSENWISGTASGRQYFTYVERTHLREGKCLTNYYNYVSAISTSVNYGVRIGGGEFTQFVNVDITSVDDWKTWLSNNNVEVVYQLATPTNTEITYTPLIEQLNTLEEAQSKEGTTNINQVNNDLPFIIDLTYYTGDTSITITNDGNIYSKPLLELKGTGNINIYLNGIQVFVVSLNNEIIYIDTDKMEAYYQGTLKNRQVVGDYNNFKLQSGNNTIQVDGGYVEYLKITNYSRWV